MRALQQGANLIVKKAAAFLTVSASPMGRYDTFSWEKVAHSAG